MLGIETVYQDLALFDNLSPSDNFFAGRELGWPDVAAARAAPAAPAARWSARRERCSTACRSASRTSTPPSGCMSGGQRQAVAVARAAAFASRIVILDEPTAALGVRESRTVLDLIRRLRDDGRAVIVISHALDHVIEIADRAVVMRRGRKVGELVPTAENQQDIVALIVGGAG